MIDELGLARFAVGPTGDVRGNALATSLLTRNNGSLEDAVASLLGGHAVGSALAQGLRDAQRGVQSSHVLQQPHPAAGWKLLFAPSAQGAAELVCVPPQALATASTAAQLAGVQAAARVAHEASNALTSVLGFAELAQQHGATPQVLAQIEECARLAQGALRNLLDAAAVRREKSPAERLEVGPLVKEVLRLLRPLARQRDVELGAKTPRALAVDGARIDLWTAVWNLVQNAVEATPVGGAVHVEVTADPDRLTIRVTDQGPGVPQEQRSRLFEPFFTTKQQGTGLGLSLVKEACERLGGSVALAQHPENGAQFVIDLPRAKDAVHTPRTAPPAAPTARKPRDSGVRPSLRELDLHVLVVDDDDALRAMLATALDVLGARAHAVSSRAEALALTGPWDLAIIDFTLKDGRGDELMTALRAQPQRPLVVLTSGTEPGALASEPDAWLRKPFDMTELVDVIRHVLAAHVDRRAQRAGRA